MPEYSYTDDDRMMPVYCIGCRKHIPKKESDAGLGFCPSCKKKNLKESEYKKNKMLFNPLEEYESNLKRNWEEFQSEIKDQSLEILHFLGVTVIVVLGFCGFVMNDSLKREETRKEREKYQQQIVHYQCEYCGMEFSSTRGEGKPHAYEISPCYAVKSGFHSLFEE
jgi:hypothetical protein